MSIEIGIINEWIEAKKKLDEYKKLESELRMSILTTVWPNSHEGIFKKEIEGIEIKGTFENSAKIDVAELEQLEESMTEDELDCITYKPSLSMTKYKALADEERETLDECISFKPAMPTLSIKEINDEG